MIFNKFHRPGAALLCLLALGGCTKLGLFNAFVPKDTASSRVVEGISYGPADRQKLDVYVPEGRTSKGTLVFIYGGSWNSGRKEDYGFVGRAFASLGYTTIVPDYRLVPEVRYPAFVEDAAAAVAWTTRNVSRYGADPYRIFLAGHSAGAYNAIMLALSPEFLLAEGVSPDVVSCAAGLSGPYDFLPLDSDATREAFAGIDDLRRTQPVNRVAKAAPPIFLATGDADETVSPRHTAALSRALTSGRQDVQVKTYQRIGHAGILLALSRPLRSRAPVLQDMNRFFETCSR